MKPQNYIFETKDILYVDRDIRDIENNAIPSIAKKQITLSDGNTYVFNLYDIKNSSSANHIWYNISNDFHIDGYVDNGYGSSFLDNYQFYLVPNHIHFLPSQIDEKEFLPVTFYAPIDGNNYYSQYVRTKFYETFSSKNALPITQYYDICNYTAGDKFLDDALYANLWKAMSYPVSSKKLVAKNQRITSLLKSYVLFDEYPGGFVQFLMDAGIRAQASINPNINTATEYLHYLLEQKKDTFDSLQEKYAFPVLAETK